MVKEVKIFIVLLFLLIAILCIFNARWIVKNKVEKNKENIIVTSIKIVGYIVSVLSLLALYYINNY